MMKKVAKTIEKRLNGMRHGVSGDAANLLI